ncbi:MAG: CotH kinase family protein [Oscillospiraceae bacterium]|nr:CotH kinase family protein [Oscillospiraceae bacterium]
MTQNNRKRIFLIAGCLCVLLAAMVFVPDFFNADLGYKNQSVAVTLPNRIDDNIAEMEFSLPVIYLYSHEIDKLLPNWVWTADGPPMPLREESKVDVYVFNRLSNKVTDIPTHVYYSSFMKLRGRTSSFMQQKRPLSLEFRDTETGENLNYPFLDMAAESDWVFHAPYIDRSLIRNFLAYTLQRQALDWAPDCQFAEVFIDTPEGELDSKDYAGVYLIVQKIKKGKNNIAIGDFTIAENPEEQFEKGGNYIFKRDAYEPGYDTAVRLDKNTYGNAYSLVYPKAIDTTEETEQTVFREIELYEKALYEGTDEELAKYYDLEEFAECMLITEFLKNHESFTSSMYFYRAKGDKIKPVAWDFDIGTGNADYTVGLYNARQFYLFKREIVQPFLTHESYVQLVIDKWREFRAPGGLLSDENITALIDDAELQLEGAWQRNDAAYPDMWKTPPYANRDNNDAQNSQEERDYIRAFLTERGRWLDEHIEEIAEWY